MQGTTNRPPDRHHHQVSRMENKNSFKKNGYSFKKEKKHEPRTLKIYIQINRLENKNKNIIIII